MERRKSLLLGAAILVGLAIFAWYNGLPRAGRATLVATDSRVLYGVVGATGELIRYGLESGDLDSIGTVRLSDGTVLTGVGASAYVPRNTNIFAFWADPSDRHTKLVYINSLTAAAAIVGQDLGTGRVTGAVAVKPQAGAALGDGQSTPLNEIGQHGVYAVRALTVDVGGEINVNPNSSPDNELLIVKGDGEQITRDSLKGNLLLTLGGVYYEGPAQYVRVRAKGDGIQNTLLVNGGPYLITNERQYTFTIRGNLNVKLYNPRAGTPSGHWYLQFTGTDVIVQEDTAPLAQVVEVNPRTGACEVVMPLGRVYESLAASTSAKFYATYGQELYELTPTAGTEILIGALQYADTKALECVDGRLYGFSAAIDRLIEINPSNGATVGSPINPGVLDMDAFIFMRGADAPTGTRFD
jgi:hypothetical protein